MDKEVSAMQWCSDIVDTRLSEVLHSGGKGSNKAKASALSGLGNRWRRYVGIFQGQAATSRSHCKNLNKARFFLL